MNRIFAWFGVDRMNAAFFSDFLSKRADAKNSFTSFFNFDNPGPSSKNPKSIKSHRKSSQRRRTKKIILTDEELKKLDTMVDVISDEENVNEKNITNF